MKDKKSFVFHREWYEALKRLDDSIRLEVYDAIMCYVFEEKEVELSSLSKMAMCFITPQLQREIERYNSICESRKAFGRKGGVAKASKSQQKVAKASKSKQNVASVADNDIILDTNVSMNNKEKEDTNVSKKESELETLFDAFRKKYKSYGGRTRGLQVELENLKKKHKDWKEIIPMLDYALEKENEAREQAKMRREFFPEMKNLQTYINQRSWEMYSEGYEDYDPNEYHPADLEFDPKYKAYRFWGINPQLSLVDGYSDDDRPDGARVVEQCNVYVWRSNIKDWERIFNYD